MKRYSTILWALVLASLLPRCADKAPVDPDVTLRTLTFNIRYANPDDGDHRWELRKDWVAETIRDSGADLVGLQEALRHQIDTLMVLLPAYGWVGQGRDDGRDAGEFSPVLFRKDRLQILSTGTFWLSPTPEVAGSRGWDAALPRIVTWAAFRDRNSGRLLYHFNTHFDHIGEVARRSSAHLVRERIHEIARTTPFVLTGDFNATDTSAVYAELMRDDPGLARLNDARAVAADPDVTTYRGFEIGSAQERTIDFVFASDDFTIEEHRVIDESRNGSYPSDHLPVLASMLLPAKTP